MPDLTTSTGCPLQLPYKVELAPNMGDEVMLLLVAVGVLVWVCTRAQGGR